MNGFKVVGLATLFASSSVFGQYSTVDSLDAQYLNWYEKSFKEDKILGVGSEKAYNELLKGKETKKTIVVAVIDSGVDTDHEDLKGQIWENEDEIPDNGIDDDNNGYIDDMNGWNFLGNANGDMVNEANLELTRIYREYRDKYGTMKPSLVPEDEKFIYDQFVKARDQYQKDKEQYTQLNNQYKKLLKFYLEIDNTLKKEMNVDELTMDLVKKFKTKDEKLKDYKARWIGFNKLGLTEDDMNETIDYFTDYTKYYLNTDFNPRRDIIKDEPFNIKNTSYGNNKVEGKEADHGTMVSGLIAAVRNNGIGVNGIATDVKIMALRTVPNGDENDKDVALAIRYAVDNGANIINMSFGKKYSPMKGEVDEAMRYAQEHNVLLISAAGNDGLNIDQVTEYPNPVCKDGDTIQPYLSIGANSKDKKKKVMAASFSNYGKNNVQIFAPGVSIISTSPDSKYDKMNGTSFACPITTGVAALVWSYYPELSALELRSILMESAENYSSQKVIQPNEDGYSNKVTFGSLSETGGIVNAYNALLLAEKKVAAKK